MVLRNLQEGTWSLRMGSRPAPHGRVEFRVWAPFSKTKKVEVAIQSKSGDWATEQMLEEEEQGGEDNRGVYSVSLDLEPGTRYLYVLDGSKKRPDPVSRYQPDGVFAPSEVLDPGSFTWTDQSWRGVAQEDLLIYEVHTGTYSKAGTFEAISPHLERLRDRLGVTALELMPVAQFPGDRNWGYDGVFPYAVQNSYGGPIGLKALVDDCHAHGLAVILDVVYNHIGPEGNCLADYGPYFSYKYRTPWGPAINYDERGCDGVRRFVVENALYWVSEYHIDGLRLDAIHGIFDFSPKHILTEIGDAVRSQESALQREIHVIAESDLNDPRVISDKAVGGHGLDAQWSDDFHHAVHSCLTEERSHYYQDFGDLADIEKALRDGFVYDGRYSKFRGRSHGAPSSGLPGERFVICLQNHDQVGNRRDGARLITLLRPSQLRTAIGLLLLAPNIPLLFMGEEFGDRTPFYYFTSHGDPKLAEAVREGRRREFEHGLGASGAEFLDPQARRTFELSKIDHSLMKREENLELFRYYRKLIALRREHPALRGLDRDLMEIRRVGRAIGVRRWKPGVEELLAVYALGESPEPEEFFPGGAWSTKVFDSERASDGSAARGSAEKKMKDQNGARARTGHRRHHHSRDAFGVAIYANADYGRAGRENRGRERE